MSEKGRHRAKLRFYEVCRPSMYTSATTTDSGLVKTADAKDKTTAAAGSRVALRTIAIGFLFGLYHDTDHIHYIGAGGACFDQITQGFEKRV
jgi:hypothetical protein